MSPSPYESPKMMFSFFFLLLILASVFGGPYIPPASQSATPPVSLPCVRSRDRHIKVNGRDRRVRLSKGCAEKVFQFQRLLGHKTAGETIQWLLDRVLPRRHLTSTEMGTSPSSVITYAVPIRCFPSLSPIDGFEPIQGQSSSSAPSIDQKGWTTHLSQETLIINKLVLDDGEDEKAPEDEESLDDDDGFRYWKG